MSFQNRSKRKRSGITHSSTRITDQERRPRTTLPVLVGVGIFLIGVAFSCGRQQAVESPSKANMPPAITSVQILPEKPTSQNDLSMLIQCRDPDGDPVSYEYQWLKNDEELPGENKSMLATGRLRKGDFYRVRVVASDGKEKGQPFLSPAVRVMNSPPVIQEVRVEPTVGHVNDHPMVSVKGMDKDGDFVYFSYQWEVNGSKVPEETGEKLERTPLKKGDSVTVLATPDDRETLGTPKKSDPVRIVNSPPVIVSSPPSSPEGNIYLYPVKANDPDQDPLTFTLRQGAKGMTIDAKSGLLRWEIRPEDKGTHTIEIEVSDNEGAKSIQRYSLSVDFK